MRTLLLAAMAGLAVGCSSSSDGSGSRPTKPFGPTSISGAAGAHTGAAGSGASGSIEVDNPNGSPAGSHAIDTAGRSGDSGIVDAGAPDAPLTSDNSCGKGKAEAKLKPVNMFVMFDRSGSMR